MEKGEQQLLFEAKLVTFTNSLILFPIDQLLIEQGVQLRWQSARLACERYGDRYPAPPTTFFLKVDIKSFSNILSSYETLNLFGHTCYLIVKKILQLATSGNRTRAARVAGQHSTTEPTIIISFKSVFEIYFFKAEE